MAVERRRAGRVVWEVGTLCLGLAVLCFVGAAWTLWPTPGPVTGEALRVVVLDASASVTRVRPGWAGRFAALLRKEARAAETSQQGLVVVTVSPLAQTRWGPGAAQDFLREEAEGRISPLQWAPTFGEDRITDWSGALQLLGGLLERKGIGRCAAVLYTDGHARDSTAWRGLARLAARGLDWQYGELSTPQCVDAALVQMDLPAQLPPEVRGSVRVQVAWRGFPPAASERWPWVITVSNAAGPIGETRGEMEPKGTGRSGEWSTCTLDWALPKLPAGVYRVHAKLEGVPGDRAPENQGRRGLLRVGDPLQVLVVDRGGPNSWASNVVRGITVPGMQCQEVGLSELGEWLPKAHAVVTLDVPPSALPGRVLSGFVERGGSWLAFGEESMLPGWSGRNPTLGADVGGLLPLDVAPGDGPQRDVILLVDGSGSMQGNPWTQVQSATLTLLRSVSRHVNFEVHLFTHKLLDAALQLAAVEFDGGNGEVQESRTQTALRSFLQARVPGGKTNIMRSLEDLIAKRVGQGPCKVVLITDGWQNDGGSWDPASLIEQMRAIDMELAIVATSENPNLSDLGLLLPLERILLAEDWKGLAQILEQELLGEVVRRSENMSVLPRAPGAGDRWGLPEWASDARAPVRSYVKTRLRPGAITLLASDHGEPIVAVVPRRSGVVLQGTSLQGAPFLRNAHLGLQGWILALAQAARESQEIPVEIVEWDGQYFLSGAGRWAHGDSSGRLEVRGVGQETWLEVPLELGTGRWGLDPRDWLRLGLEGSDRLPGDRFAARWRFSRPGLGPVELGWPGEAPAELLPGGHLWPRDLPEGVAPPRPVGGQVPPAGPWALVLGMLTLVIGLGFQARRGKGFPDSADRN